jgi:hypothetical protein
MREFLQSLVLLAHHLYSNTISGGVSDCLSHFLSSCILPHACSLTGTVFASLPPTSLHQEQCWKLYQLMAQPADNGTPSVSMRALLWKFKDRGLTPGLLSAREVVGALVQDQPLAGHQGDWNLEIKTTVLDVLETVLRCCRVMSCDQSHDQIGESSALSFDEVCIFHTL